MIFRHHRHRSTVSITPRGAEPTLTNQLAMSPRLKSRLIAVATLIVFAAALWVLHRSLGKIRWEDVRAHLDSLPRWRIAAALAFAAGSYIMLTFYDLLGVRFVGSALPWRRVAPISFMAYAFGHNLGFATLTGGALRLHDYTRRGLSGRQVAGVVSLCAITFGLGVNVLLDYALLLHAHTASKILHVAPLTAQFMGLGNVGLLLGYLWLTAGRADRPFTLGGQTFSAPPLRFALMQITVSVADLACSAAALFLLLPPLHLGYPAFIGLYALAMAAAIVSNVPGGLGVFESVLILVLPNLATAALIGGVLAFRAAYYLLPFILALLLLAAREARGLLRRSANRGS